MGNRAEGRVKKKSIKANVTSKFSAKRRLSRMGKKLKKGQMGPSTEFVTRASALKKLQITLKDFRRLCILKGIYPRVPPKASKGSDKVYYDIKDLAYLSHEPLLAKFREFKTFMRKIRKASGRNQFDEARRKDAVKPQMQLDHLVKERYPRFIDALRDLDDTLCMIHMFAALPSVGRVTAARTAASKELLRQWQYYVVRSKTLRKVFVSVKGVYYQAEIMGEPITWLVPHPFTQHIPKEVDFRVMLTFLDFYETFLKFVMFKLYSSLGMQYPPIVDAKANSEGAFLLAVRSDGTETAVTPSEQPSDKVKLTDKERALAASMEAKVASIAEDIDAAEEEDEEDTIPLNKEHLASAFESIHGRDDGDEGAEEQQVFATDSADDARVKLFKNYTFFVNREVNLELMQLCIMSFGGKVGWEGAGSPFTADSPLITHHIIDRPLQGVSTISSREYIQPQWVFDSINAAVCLPVAKYRAGVTLPPHLSPFVDDAKEGYIPSYRNEINKLTSVAQSTEEAADSDEVASDASGEDASESYEMNLALEKKGTTYSKKQQQKKQAEESSSEEEEEGNGEESIQENSDDEEKEVPIAPAGATQKGSKGVVYAPKDASNKEEDLAHIMMGKKTKRLYGRMQHGIQKKKEIVDRLAAKRKSLETEKESNKRTKKSKKQ